LYDVLSKTTKNPQGVLLGSRSGRLKKKGQRGKFQRGGGLFPGQSLGHAVKKGVKFTNFYAGQNNGLMAAAPVQKEGRLGAKRKKGPSGLGSRVFEQS